MPRVDLTPTTLPAPYADAPATLTWEAADPVEGNQVTLSGNEVLLVRNDDAADQTVTITSAPDPTYGRTEDLGPITIPAGGYRAFQRFKLEGWRQPDGYLYIDASAATMMFAVLRLPAGSS